MIILRDFIFLNTNMLRNYLSSIDGYAEEEFDYTETKKGQKGGKLGHSVIEGNASLETSREEKSKRILTPPAQFQKLYEALEKQEQIRHLDLFDNDYWNTIQKGEILEIQAKIRIPALMLQFEQVEGFTPFIDIVQKFGLDIVKDSDRAMLDGVSDLRKMTESKPIPLLFRPVSTSGFNFSADFQGEVVVFGKVQRIISKGEKVEVFSLLPDTMAMPNLNRQQRLALKSNKNKQAKDNLTETLIGPGIVLTPLAVFR